MITSSNTPVAVFVTSLSLLFPSYLSAQTFSNNGVENTAIEKIEVEHQKQPYRGDVPLKLTPQAVNVISGDLLQDVGIINFQEALDFSSSIVRQNNFGGMWDGFAIRGFAGDENLPSGYLVNGFSAGRGYSGKRNTANIETIEILKGPGSALYGRSEPGGTVNIITKKPQFFEQGSMQATVGNFDTKRLEADYTNAINDDLAFRVNGSYEDSGSFRDTVEIKNMHVTPSVLYNMSDKTNISYELEILDQEVPFDRGIIVVDNNVNTVPNHRFLGEPNDGPMKIEATGHQLVLQHQINSQWDLLTGLSYRDSSFKGFSTDAELSGGRQLLGKEGTETLLNRQRRHRDFNATDLSARVEFSGHVEFAGLTHHILVGADAYDYELDTIQSRWRTAWGAGDTTYNLDINNPVYDQTPPDVAVFVDRVEEQDSLGIYFQDQIDLTDKWKALVGLRVDQFDQTITNRANNSITEQDQTATSPRFGLVYEANEYITLYSSYAEGFRPNSGANSQGEAFDPEESESFEVGMKWSSIDDIFNGAIAFYQADKSNILTADPNPNNSGFSAALGEAESQGIELDIESNISDNTTLALSYAYIDAKTSNTVTNADWGVSVPAGSRLINIAKHNANITLRHFFTVANKEADTGISYNYVGDRLGETIDPTYILPSYSTVRLFGSLNVANNLSVQFDVDNLFDKEYFASSYHKLWTMPGMPRNYRVGIKYEF